MKTKNQVIEDLRAAIIEIRDAKLLPKNYAAIIADQLGLSNKNQVYRTISGQNSDLDIMEAIIELAENSREKRLLERARKVLE